MKVFSFSMPIPIGGANAQQGDEILLWRRHGIEVTCVCLEHCSCGRETVKPWGSNPWTRRLMDAGVEIHMAEPGKLDHVPGLTGSIVAGWCNSHLCHNREELHRLGCRVLWIPCMNFASQHEVQAFRERPPDAVVFQSEFQHSQISEEYEAWGCETQRIIHGYLDPLPFQPRPRVDGQSFTVGRLARAVRTKWHHGLWDIVREVRRRGEPLEALAMAWNDDLEQHCGHPPEGCAVYPACAMPTGMFLSHLHAMICPNWGDKENWPRVGLEAMSTGVPLVVDDAGGWREMCDGAAIYCRSPEEYVEAILSLARDETRRRELIDAGRERLAEINDEEILAGQWSELFRTLA